MIVTNTYDFPVVVELKNYTNNKFFGSNIYIKDDNISFKD